MINITLNGNNYEISNPITIKELLDEYKIEGYKIAVAAIEDGEILRLNKNIKEDKNIKIIIGSVVTFYIVMVVLNLAGINLF